MKGRRALDPEESAFLKLIASVLKEDSSVTPRAQQGNAAGKPSAFPKCTPCKDSIRLHSSIGRWKWHWKTSDENAGLGSQQSR